MATSKNLARKPAPPLKPDPNVPQPGIENQPAVTQENQPEAERLKREAEYQGVYPGTPKPLTPAQEEYKRVYPNTVYPLDVPGATAALTPAQTQSVALTSAQAVSPAGLKDANLGGLKAQVDQALASTELKPAVRRQLDEAFANAAKGG